MKKTALILASLFVLPCTLMASIRTLGIAAAIKDHVIKLEAVNTEGNYTGRSVKLIVSNNNKKDSLDLKVDLGTILKPADDSHQPMVLGGEEVLVVATVRRER